MQRQSCPAPRGSPYGGTARLGSLVHELPPSCRSDKGTTVRHGISAAGAVLPSASVNRQARRVALTPCVPLSRGAGEGDYGVRKRSFRPAEADASALQRVGRAAPLSHCVGEGLGVRAESRRTLHTMNSSDVPLSAPAGSPCRQGEGGFTFTCFCELRLRGWYQCFVAPLEPKHLNLPTLPPKVAGIDTPSV
jgi:hypothetical protein